MADNQLKYLQNMAKGKTATGAAANQGQIKWANAQLAKIPQPASVPKPTTNTVPSGMSVPKGGTVPKPPNVPNPTTSGMSIPTGSSVPNPANIAGVSNLPKIPQGGSVPTPPPTGYSNPQLADWSQKQQDLFKQWEQMSNTPFQYDPNSDPAYQAQVQLAQQRAQVASRNALEAANDRGLLTSSLATNQLGQIQQSAEQEAMSYIPQYRDQAYNQYRNNLAQVGEMLGQAYNLRNQQFNEATTEAQLTGSYMPAGAQQIVNQIYQLKSQAETKGITREERDALSSQANQLRSQLTAMGVDVSGLGADTSLANTRVGQRTLEGQRLDYAQQTDQRDFNEGVRRYDQDYALQEERYAVADQQWQQEYGMTLAQVTGYMPDGTPTSEQQQRNLANLWTVADQTGAIPAELANLYGLRPGTPTRTAKEFAAQLAIQQQNANSSSTSAAASMMNAQTNRQQENRLRSNPSSSSSSSSSSTKVDSKNSYELYHNMIDNFISTNATAAERRALAEYYKGQLSDSDYRKILDWKPSE